MALVHHERIELAERSRIEQRLDPLAGRPLARAVLALDPGLSSPGRGARLRVSKAFEQGIAVRHRSSGRPPPYRRGGAVANPNRMSIPLTASSVFTRQSSSAST